VHFPPPRRRPFLSGLLLFMQRPISSPLLCHTSISPISNMWHYARAGLLIFLILIVSVCLSIFIFRCSRDFWLIMKRHLSHALYQLLLIDCCAMMIRHFSISFLTFINVIPSSLAFTLRDRLLPLLSCRAAFSYHLIERCLWQVF